MARANEDNTIAYQAYKYKAYSKMPSLYMIYDFILIDLVPLRLPKMIDMIPLDIYLDDG